MGSSRAAAVASLQQDMTEVGASSAISVSTVPAAGCRRCRPDSC